MQKKVGETVVDFLDIASEWEYICNTRKAFLQPKTPGVFVTVARISFAGFGGFSRQ